MKGSKKIPISNCKKIRSVYLGGKLEIEAFTQILKEFGLELDETHKEELYSYVQKLIPLLKNINELNISDFESFSPLMIFEEL